MLETGGKTSPRPLAARRAAAAAATAAAPGTCQSFDLELAASLTWSCRPGVTVFGAAAIRRCPLQATNCRRLGPASTSASGFDAPFKFGLRFALRASTLALVLDEHFGPRIKFVEYFGLQASRSSTAPSGFDASFGLPCALRRMPSALAERRRHTALAAGGRLNRAQTGNLMQPPCPCSCVVPLYIYCRMQG